MCRQTDQGCIRLSEKNYYAGYGLRPWLTGFGLKRSQPRYFEGKKYIYNNVKILNSQPDTTVVITLKNLIGYGLINILKTE